MRAPLRWSPRCTVSWRSTASKHRKLCAQMLVDLANGDVPGVKLRDVTHTEPKGKCTVDEVDFKVSAPLAVCPACPATLQRTPRTTYAQICTPHAAAHACTLLLRRSCRTRR
jgi:hypothetical protein